MFKSALLSVTVWLGAACGAQPIIDNERVAVWDVTATAADPDPVPVPVHHRDFVTIYLAESPEGTHRKGDVVFAHDKDAALGTGERAIIVELKDKAVPSLANKSGYPNAFPRPHVRKVLENERVLIWSYAWNPGEPTPMHFHDKDVVVVYMEDTALKSTAPDGRSVLNEYSAFQTKFNARDRIHTELLARGTGSAIMVELK